MYKFLYTENRSGTSETRDKWHAVQPREKRETGQRTERADCQGTTDTPPGEVPMTSFLALVVESRVLRPFTN